MLRGYGLISALSFLLASVVTAPLYASVPDKADVRVLIDVSGSMKKNDPRNLRRSALRLLVGLLPKDTRAGVWTFGQYVNMQVPLGKVDDNWKKRARIGAGKIHSRGLFTNIEQVMKRSTEDWGATTDTHRRSVILLTDGMVDISKKASENNLSKQRILDSILPKLKALGAQIHTIALSENADHELMKELAGSTGGWYEQVDDADQLQRVFLRLFEKVGKPDSLPLKDNRFTIDNSISEATLLVFRKAEGRETRVQTPNGEIFGADGAPDSVTWHRDEGYDLLTIANPQAGEWVIQAETDPDNRVMVVTDLKMVSTDIPNLLVRGEKMPFSVSFTNNGKQITRTDFLEVIKIHSEFQTSGEELTEPQPLLDDGTTGDEKAADGRFGMTIANLPDADQAELIVRAQGKTFTRERRQTFEIGLPLTVTVEPGKEAENLMEIVVNPDEELVDPASIVLKAVLQDSAGEEASIPLKKAAKGHWEGSLDTAEFDGTRSLHLAMSGSTINGNPVELDLDPFYIEGRSAPPEAAPVETTIEPETAPDPKPAPPVEPAKVPKEQVPEEADWGSLMLIFGATNLVLIIVVGIVLFLVFRKKGDKGVTLIAAEESPA